MREHRGTINIVEDDASLSRATVRYLHATGFRCFAFETAERLLSSDLVLVAECFVLDVNLPGISGFELHAALLSRGVNQPTVFISALEHTNWSFRFDGKYQLLVKPVTGHTLIQTIVHALEAVRP